MADRETLLALADRVEREPPSRELDGVIAAAVGIACFVPGETPWGVHKYRAAPAYTSSIDAAVTLVPKDSGMRVGGGHWGAWASIAGDAPARARTYAAALCAAALRARAAMMETQDA